MYPNYFLICQAKLVHQQFIYESQTIKLNRRSPRGHLLPAIILISNAIDYRPDTNPIIRFQNEPSDRYVKDGGEQVQVDGVQRPGWVEGGRAAFSLSTNSVRPSSVRCSC